MHRMLHSFAIPTLTVAVLLTIEDAAVSALIHPPGGRGYPELAGAITGHQGYVYDPVTRTGTFQVANTPFLLSTGPAAANESIVEPNPDGIRSQVLNLRLDHHGRLIGDPRNQYAVYGTVSLQGRTFRGLLLQATPTSFGAKGGETARFNLDLMVTGGVLAQTFGPQVYIEFHPGRDTPFDGSFAKSFATAITSSRTLGTRLPLATPTRRSTTLIVLLACGVISFLRRPARSVSREELGELAYS